MKKISYYLGLVLSVILAGCSAEYEDFASPTPQQGEPIQITVGMPTPDDSRVSFEGDDVVNNQLVWNEGDQLLLVGYDNNNNYKGKSELTVTAGSEGKRTGEFTGFTVAGATQYYVYYKAGKLSGIDGGTINTTTAPNITINYTDQAQSDRDNTAHLKDYLFLRTAGKVTSANLAKVVKLSMQNAIFIFELKSLDAGLGNNPSQLDWQCGNKTIQSIKLTKDADYTNSKVYMCFDPTKPEAKLDEIEKMRILFTNRTTNDQYAVWATRASGSGTIDYAANKRYKVTIGTDSENLKDWYKYTGTTVIKIKTNNETAPDATNFGDNLELQPDKSGDYYVVKSKDDEPITAIPANFLKEQGNIIDVILPETVETIGDNAFYFCSSLKLTEGLPNSITSIGNSAFYNCTLLNLNLTEELPNNITSIGNYAFLNCQNLKLKKLPDNVTKIGEGAFLQCIQIEFETLPTGLTEISNSAFFNCTRLKLTEFPDNVTEIGSKAFSGCSSLKLTTLPAGVTKIGASAFAGASLGADAKTFTLPASVVSIGYFAFQNVTNVTEFVIASPASSDNPRTLDYGVSIFQVLGVNQEKTSLEKVTLPNDIKAIPDNMFDGCTKLKALTIPASVTSIGTDVILGCTALQTLTVETENTMTFTTGESFRTSSANNSNPNTALKLAQSWLSVVDGPGKPSHSDGYSWAGCTWKTIEVKGTGGGFTPINPVKPGI